MTSNSQVYDAKVPEMCSIAPISTSITILHFNDVYNVEPAEKEPVGGAARFACALKSYEHLNPLILFSGDVIAPSMLSTFTKGEHMIPVLNDCNVHCAVFGNHEFDFGLDYLRDWVSKTNFPWLMSNVIDNETGRPLADGKITHTVQWGGHKIGLIGLVERQWLDTLTTITKDDVTFIDFVEAGKKLNQQLRQEGCEYVIALTHMRTPNDIIFSEGVPEIDLVLGGHDHISFVREFDGRYLIKSGSDFRQFSKITLTFTGKKVDVDIEEINVTSELPEDESLKLELEKYSSVIAEKMEEVLAVFTVPLDGRFSSMRTSETNLGNWVCDAILAATGADFVILNSGALRSDREHAAGTFKMRDLMNVVPMLDNIAVLSITGSQVLKALENGVSQYPRLEGRFPQVSGISFGFDPEKPAGQRIDPQFVRICGKHLSLDQRYRLATKNYVARGKDGYDCLLDAEVVIDADNCIGMRTAIQNRFEAIKIRNSQTKSHVKHGKNPETISNGDFLNDQELSPRIEGRIVKLTPETRRELERKSTNFTVPFPSRRN